MANVEAASAATTGGGPRYAPDDPSLPKPWKGLIDGNTGLTYYWNPETNATQYERPTSGPAPFPSGVPPTDTTQSVPKPVMQHGQTAEAPQYQQQYMNQSSQQQGQFQVPLTGQVAQQQPSQVPQVSASMQQASQMGAFPQQYAHFGQGMPQRGSQLGQGPMQQGQVLPQMYGMPLVQQSGQQLLPQQGSQMVQQPTQHTSPSVGQQALQHQGPPVAQSQGQSFFPQHMQYGAYQQPMLPQGQQNASPFTQQIQQGPLFSYQQDNRNGIPQRDNSDFSKVKQTGISIPQAELSGPAVSQGPPSINASNHALQAGGLSGSVGSSVHVHQPTPSINLPDNHNDIVHSQHASAYQNQMNQSMMHTQQHGLPAIGPRMGYDGTPQGSAGQENHFIANRDVPIMASQHPKLAAIPMVRNQQDMMMGGFPLQNAPPSRDTGLSTVAAHGAPSMYNQGNIDLPISNHTLLRPPPMMPGSADVMNIPSAEAYRQQHEVTATGDNVPAPFMTFEATGFPPEILREIHSAGFSSPTPIQAQTWPIALQNTDIVAIAKTGSGKTLGYLMPAFIHLRHRQNNPRHGPTVLVLAPTRELATQIQDEAIKFGRSSRVSCTCLYGGAPKGPQLEELRRGADVVVATPGRLNDILETRNIDLRQVSLLVLDEADRMLDMGFEPQIRKIVNEIPPHRQTLMYTATWPKEVRKIASDLLNNPVQVNIGSVDELAANKSITQFVEVVPHMEKQRRLEQILRSQERGSKVIIFCSTKKLCDELTRSIRRNFPAAAIHGDKSQGERDYVLNQFRSGKSPILVATDVAARGLDIKDIRVVINYDFPTGIEDYVHRIGRTGRAGATGLAYTFLSEQDWKHAADLVKVLEGANQQVPPEVREMALRGGPAFVRDRSDMNRFDSGPAVGGGRWDSGGRGGMRDGGFSGRGGMRDGGFGGRGGMRDGGFGFRGGMRDGGFRGAGFGGRGMRDGPISNRGGRGDFGGRGNRGRGFGGPSGSYAARSRDDYGSNERFNNRDGFGRGRGRGRFDNRRDVAGRSRGRSYSSSPEKVRTWGYSRSMSRSRSRSRSRSWSRSRSRSWSRSRSPRRNYSHSRSPHRSYSRGRSRSRSHSKDRNRGGHSRSRSHDRHERSGRRNWDQKDLPGSEIEKQSDIQNYDQKDVTVPGSRDPTELKTPIVGQGSNGDPIPEEYPGVKLDDREPASSGMVDQGTADM